jgi:hypothetical protein
MQLVNDASNFGSRIQYSHREIWLHNMETLKQWSQVNENFDAKRESVVGTAGTNNLGLPIHWCQKENK